MRLWTGQSRRRRVLIVVGTVGALALVGALSGLAASGAFTGGGGKALAPTPTTGNFAPFHFNEPPSDPDSNTLTGQDVATVLSRMQGHGHYRLEVSNVSNLGFINAFNWVPPAGMKLLRVTSTSSGHCRIAAGSAAGGTETFPALACTAVSLKPPSCTCRGDGGQVVISLVATNGDDSGFLAGASSIVAATPVFEIIPGYVQAAPAPSGSGSPAANGTTSTQS